MPDEAILREKARAAIESGKLPRRAPDRTRGGAGVVRTDCAVCATPITHGQMEFEIQFERDDGDPDVDTFHVHFRCFAAWEFERGEVSP
jgi:hypothetical protein